MNEQKVTKFEPRSFGDDYANTKDLIERKVAIAYAPGHPMDFDKTGLIKVGEYRIYGTKRRNYVSFWIDGGAGGASNASASAFAGGFGYHRPSQALQDALSKAGIDLANNIGGAGDRAMDGALKAIAAHAGYTQVEVF